jgi:hypothetical protein
MARYGIDYYGVGLYGAVNPVKFDASPFTASPLGYGAIQLNWANPSGSWAKIQLVRNTYGYPVHAFDGQVLLTAFNGADPTTYVDTTNLIEGAYYYYSLYVYTTVGYKWVNAGNAQGLSVKNFGNGSKMYEYLPDVYKLVDTISSTSTPYPSTPVVVTAAQSGGDVITYTAQNTFKVGQVVSISGLSTSAFNLNNVVIKTVSNSQFTVQSSAQGLPVTGASGAASIMQDDNDLYSFLQVFGFELDYQQTLASLLTTRYDVETVSGTLLPIMLQQFGFTYEPQIGYQQSRILLRDGIKFLQKKGSSEGLVEYIKAFSSYAIPEPISGTPNPSVNGLTIGHNLFLDYNDSSFEEASATSSGGYGRWDSLDGTASINRVNTASILSMSLTSNVATLTIGAHTYLPGNKIYVNNSPLPIFNSPNTALTITAVTATTISYALTYSTNIPPTSGYNPLITANGVFGSYAQVAPAPNPWAEPTTAPSFPNKQTGVLSLTNASTSSQSVDLYCGDVSPIYNGIPVTAGLSYSFSFYAANGGTARNVTAKIKWFDRFGVYISTSSGSPVSDSVTVFGSSVRPYVTATAPSTAYYAAPGISIASVAGSASQEFHYVDAAQFEQSASVTSFDEARNVHITLKATRINELLNPTFASPITPWVVTGATHDVDTDVAQPNGDIYTITNTTITTVSGTNYATVTLSTPHVIQAGQDVWFQNVSGTGVTSSNYNGAQTVTNVIPPTLYSFSFVTTAGTQASLATTGTVFASGNGLGLTATSSTVSVTTAGSYMGIYYPSTSYTFSVWFKAYSGSESISTTIKWYDSSYTLISSATGGTYTATYSASLPWYRAYVTAIAPSTAAYATVEIDWLTASSGEELSLNQALFENSAFVQDFFDGSQGPADSGSLFWEGGITNGARSHYYRNRLAIENRLINGGITDYLPLGTTYALYLAQPNT